MDFKVNIKDYENKIKSACIDTLEISATIAVAETQTRTPVKSGALRRSITHSGVDGVRMSVAVGSAISYAKYVEEGYTQNKGQYVKVLGKRLTGKRIKGRFMIHDGIAVAQGKVENILKQKLEEKFNND